ncbi:MAG: 1-acyl-sn-glycerol-3-phosphate acyltransferase [Lachnospiraceae bacterium]|nr:1-acyl-sn-glycerol-3-phosphate acyltransferase [Lachnospiraceae bacterium]
MNRIVLMCLRNLWRVPGAYIKLCHYAKHTDRYTEEEMWAHIHYIMNRAVTSGNIDLKITGEENIPRENGFLFCANHQGMFDVVALSGTYSRPLGVIFKKELANVPFLKQIVACTKSFGLDRDDVRQSMGVIAELTKELKKGRSYVIYPEGTRSRNGNQMGEFHAGSFRAAVKAKAPIVPIAYIDSYKVLDQKGCKPVSVQMHYLPPLTYEEYKDMKTPEIAELVKGRIAEVIEHNI